MAPVGIRYRSNTYQNIGCKFNKGCIIFLICKNNRLKLQYPCIRRYQSYQQRCSTISGLPTSSESSGEKRSSWLLSEELVVLGSVMLVGLDMLKSTVFSDGAEGVLGMGHILTLLLYLPSRRWFPKSCWGFLKIVLPILWSCLLVLLEPCGGWW